MKDSMFRIELLVILIALKESHKPVIVALFKPSFSSNNDGHYFFPSGQKFRAVFNVPSLFSQNRKKNKTKHTILIIRRVHLLLSSIFEYVWA